MPAVEYLTCGKDRLAGEGTSDGSCCALLVAIIANLRTGSALIGFGEAMALGSGDSDAFVLYQLFAAAY